jgi:acyl-coenzyme A thioesterase PaaI-like protein
MPEPLQDLLATESGARICFGCGADNHHGLRIKSVWEGDRCVCRFTPDDHHTAFPGIVNGGIIASVLDCHGIWTAVADAEAQQGRDPHAGGFQSMFVTGKLSVEYLKPTPMGQELVATGRVVARGERSTTVELRLRAGETVVARAEVVAVRVGGK